MLSRAFRHSEYAKGLHRQRLQRRVVEPLEQLSPARAVDAHPPVVQFLEQLGDPSFQHIEREKGFVPQPRIGTPNRDSRPIMRIL